MGQHFARLVELARGAGELQRYWTTRAKAGDESVASVVDEPWAARLMRWTPVRFSRGWSAHLTGELWDRKIAQLLRGPIECAVGMNGQAEHFFAAAKSFGAQRLELIAATPHVNHVRRQHDRARRMYSIESDWLNEAQRRKTVREYSAADVIYVGSDYTRQSFLEEGVPSGKLRKVNYGVDPRFNPPPAFDDDGVFRIVYTGMIVTNKGVPLLLDAFARTSLPRAELVLIGGTTTRPMRRWMEAAIARDHRIKMASGDPLPALRRASVYVHPSFQDGYGYAPMEALACGVPVVVSEDTGMKEHVRDGINGYIVPTGEIEPLIDRLEHLARCPLRGRFSPPALIDPGAPRVPSAC